MSNLKSKNPRKEKLLKMINKKPRDGRGGGKGTGGGVGKGGRRTGDKDGTGPNKRCPKK